MFQIKINFDEYITNKQNIRSVLKRYYHIINEEKPSICSYKFLKKNLMAGNQSNVYLSMVRRKTS